MAKGATKFDLVSQIEHLIGRPTEKLWRTDKASLERIANVLYKCKVSGVAFDGARRRRRKR
jgi:hypothetical protein